MEYYWILGVYIFVCGGVWAVMTSWDIENVFLCALSSVMSLHVSSELLSCAVGRHVDIIFG